MQAIAEGKDVPSRGDMALATVGLSDHGGFEVATMAPARYKSAIKALFDLASYVAGGSRALKPHEVFEKILERYYSRLDANHWLIREHAPPGLEIAPLSLPTATVTWLYAWPITSDELLWLRRIRPDQGEAVLDSAGSAAFNLSRAPLPSVPRFEGWSK